MGTGTIISIAVAVIGILLGIFFYMNDSLDKRIEKAVNHPDFVNKVAEMSKLPFLIFDQNGSFQTDSGGAASLIEKVDPFGEKDSNGKDRLGGFVVHPKKFLKDAPILQAINNSTVFVKPTRMNTMDWKYRIPEWTGGAWGGQYDEPPARLYKLEILK